MAVQIIKKAYILCINNIRRPICQQRELILIQEETMQVRTHTEVLLFHQTIMMAVTGHQLILEGILVLEEEMLHRKVVRTEDNR